MANKVKVTNDTIFNRIYKLRNLITSRWNDENKPPEYIVYQYVTFLDYIINDMETNLIITKKQQNEQTKKIIRED